MTTIEEFGVRKFEVVVTVTIGGVLLLMGLGSLYGPSSAPCTSYTNGDTLCSPSAFYLGILMTSTGVLLFVVGAVRAITSPRTSTTILPPRTRTR